MLTCIAVARKQYIEHDCTSSSQLWCSRADCIYIAFQFQLLLNNHKAIGMQIMYYIHSIEKKMFKFYIKLTHHKHTE